MKNTKDYVIVYPSGRAVKRTYIAGNPVPVESIVIRPGKTGKKS